MKAQYKWLGDNLGLGSDSAIITLQDTTTRATLYISSEDIHAFFPRMDAYSKMRIEGGLQAEIKAASIQEVVA